MENIMEILTWIKGALSLMILILTNQAHFNDKWSLYY